jgi:hypothetical protein
VELLKVRVLGPSGRIESLGTLKTKPNNHQKTNSKITMLLIQPLVYGVLGIHGT